MMIRSMPPSSAHLADSPVPAPPPTIGRPAATWARSRARISSRGNMDRPVLLALDPKPCLGSSRPSRLLFARRRGAIVGGWLGRARRGGRLRAGVLRRVGLLEELVEQLLDLGLGRGGRGGGLGGSGRPAPAPQGGQQLEHRRQPEPPRGQGERQPPP